MIVLKSSYGVISKEKRRVFLRYWSELYLEFQGFNLFIVIWGEVVWSGCNQIFIFFNWFWCCSRTNQLSICQARSIHHWDWPFAANLWLYFPQSVWSRQKGRFWRGIWRRFRLLFKSVSRTFRWVRWRINSFLQSRLCLFVTISILQGGFEVWVCIWMWQRRVLSGMRLICWFCVWGEVHQQRTFWWGC